MTELEGFCVTISAQIPLLWHSVRQLKNSDLSSCPWG